MLLALTVLSLAATPVDQWILLAETDAASRPGVSIPQSVYGAARFRLGLRFLSPEEAFVEGGVEAESGLASCAANAECLAARLRGVRADYALLFVVRRASGDDLLAIRVVRTRSGEIVHRAVLQAPVREPLATAIASISAAAFDALGYKTGGELVVDARPDNAALAVVDGVEERTIGSGRTTLLAAGPYVVRARLEGFDDANASVRVDAGATARVALALAPHKEAVTDSVWFWMGVGLAATAAAVSIGFLATRSDRCLCAAADPAQCGSCP